MKVRIFDQKKATEISLKDFLENKKNWSKEAFHYFDFVDKKYGNYKTFYFIIANNSFCIGTESLSSSSHLKLSESLYKIDGKSNVYGGGHITFLLSEKSSNLVVISGASDTYKRWWTGDEMAGFKEDEKLIRDLAVLFSASVYSMSGPNYLVLQRNAMLERVSIGKIECL
ncbi:hypothetical protein KAU09_04170 [Candidatus Parcubacteria bacterium]|nr:hypothetical protein [Candidatus Parcubacteria bacterium]